MSVLLRVILNGVALWLTSLLVPGINLGESALPLDQRVLTIVLVGAIFGVVNAVVKPLVKLFSLPLVILSLGLFTVVVNAAMLALTAWLSGKFGLDFTIRQFWWDAVIAAVVLSVIAFVLSKVLDGDRR